MAEKEGDWKSTVKTLIRRRNERETCGYAHLIASHSRLLSSTDALRAQNVTLTLEVERLRQINADMRTSGGAGGGGGGNNNNSGGDAASASGANQAATVTALEHKIYKLQEDLTDSLRRRGENAQKIIDLNNLLQEKEKEISKLTLKLVETEAAESRTLAKCKTLEDTIEDQKRTIDILRDEQQVLQIEWATLNEKSKKLQKENAALVARWMEKKSKEADELNAENEVMVRGEWLLRHGDVFWGNDGQMLECWPLIQAFI